MNKKPIKKNCCSNCNNIILFDYFNDLGDIGVCKAEEGLPFILLEGVCEKWEPIEKTKRKKCRKLKV